MTKTMSIAVAVKFKNLISKKMTKKDNDIASKYTTKYTILHLGMFILCHLFPKIVSTRKKVEMQS
ncbi:hypothetical protein PRIP_03543 [Listeria riparia FSL S10-1204]|uniref:Uncharacterized protein n=1 Tax=Listeria riparia FSL S10-1204 TaxID=1265816 RepID=W7D3C8_9LIST|nr:hypothetical protein PRIP_03543 [Listeria riparia FSL S10-1204]